ncbi:hypothetical protein COB52_02925 [Candidatus Kaiserbacteria bacterium]|nr:MAG: hypothetical protein COB52_02925 [Candidatus Kaiserbacteria bacterium]
MEKTVPKKAQPQVAVLSITTMNYLRRFHPHPEKHPDALIGIMVSAITFADPNDSASDVRARIQERVDKKFPRDPTVK